MLEIARKVERATGEAFGAVCDQLLKEGADKDAAAEVRAYAAKNTANLPPPLEEATKPPVAPMGPRDAARYAQRGLIAQKHYQDRGDARDLAELVIKSPQWYRDAAADWRDPERGIRRLPLSRKDRLTVWKIATLNGRAWGEWGRGFVALLGMIFRLARRTKRDGLQVLAGCSAGLLASCIPSASGSSHTLKAQTLTARRHAGAQGVPGTEGRYGGLAGDAWQHECGYIEAMRQIGILYAFQPRSDAVPRWQLGSRGYACLQFLLPDAIWAAPPEPDPPPI